MASPLLSATALAEIRAVGEGQMVTEIQIFRSTVVTPDSLGYNPDYDYGDDELSDIEIDEYDAPAGSSRAWFYTSQLQSQSAEGDNQITTIDIHEVRMPIGTDVRVSDVIRRVDNGEEFIVVDTNGSDTWAEKLRATVRRRE